MISQNRTIAAIATGEAVGGIGVIRISGNEARSIGDKVFRAVSGNLLCDSKGYRAHFGHVFDGSGWEDESVALVFAAPHSYTGEDVVELHCHGGLTTTRMALRACINAGAYPAEGGEFTHRAFENGKLSLTQAEAVMAIISAEGRQSACAAQAAHDGRLAARVRKIADDLISLAGKLSAWCDYPDEDEIPAVTREELEVSLSAAEEKLHRLVSEGERGAMLRGGIDTVICGKPNVGKSTLMNLLAGCEKSIVTDIPGTTRDIVEERISVGGCVLNISDTAGIHETDDKIETIGVDRARKKMNECALIIAVFDGSRELDDDDIALIHQVKDRPCVAVINKNDRLLLINDEYISDKIQRVVYISAAMGEGIEALEEAILDVTQLGNLNTSAGIIINERQISCAARSLDAVREALDATRVGITFDAINVSICDAIDSLLEFSGDKVTDRVVDEVFSHFCVGK